MKTTSDTVTSVPPPNLSSMPLMADNALMTHSVLLNGDCCPTGDIVTVLKQCYLVTIPIVTD